MQRVMVVYPNGKTTYGWFHDDGEDPCFVFSGNRYEVKDVVKTGVSVTTNNEELYSRLKAVGVPVNRTEKQHTITISVQEDTKKRLHAASKAVGRSVSNILEEISRKWLEENGY